MENKELTIHNVSDFKGKIYTIRGVQVMLDSDLAEIYGYATKDFNRQVKNNIERFDEDFRFQLTEDEMKFVSRCKISTLNEQGKGRGHNFKSLPCWRITQGLGEEMFRLRPVLTQASSLIFWRR